MSETDPAELTQHVRSRLKLLHRHLQVVHAGVVVAAAALQHQRAERDQEVARVLTYCIGDRLFAQIERTAELIASLEPFPPDPSADSHDLEERDGH